MSEIYDNLTDSTSSSPDYFETTYSNDYSSSQDYYTPPNYLLPTYTQVDGIYECNANGQNATVKNFFQCFLYRLPFWLESGGIGFLCWVLLIPVILISLFGNFKEQYRWFILNQAIWDIFMTYDFQCKKPSSYWFQGISDDLKVLFNQGKTNCYYEIYDGNTNFFYQFHVKILQCILFSPLFLLTFSRFICLYCNHFYQRHCSTVKIITFIIISNAFFIFLITIRNSYAFAVDEGRREREYYDAKRQCSFSNCPGWPPECNQIAIDMCVSQIPYLNPFWGSMLTVFEYAIPSMTLLLTIIFSCAMMYKVGKQLKFQAQQDHSSALNSTIRITVICFIQTVTVTFIFLLTSVGNLRNIAFTFTGVNEYGIEKLYKEIIPLLFEEPFIRSLNQIRIFIDNIIVLLILNGYRKTLRNFFLIIFKIAKNPNKLLNIREMTTLFVSSTTKVTVISLNSSSNKSRKF